MTDPPLNPLTSSSARPSDSPILNYLSPGGAHTPTRVHRITSWIVAILGIFQVLAGTLILFNVVMEYVDWMQWIFAYSWFYWLYWLRFDRNADLILPVLLGSESLASGIILALLARPIRRGSTRACRAALILFAFFILLMGLFTTLIAAMSVLEVAYPAGPWRNPRVPYWLVAIPGGILIILFSKDTFACLRWISRNPGQEKPPVKFLP